MEIAIKGMRTRKNSFKGTVMQTEKALINDHLRISKATRKFRIPTIYDFAEPTL